MSYLAVWVPGSREARCEVSFSDRRAAGNVTYETPRYAGCFHRFSLTNKPPDNFNRI